MEKKRALTKNEKKGANQSILVRYMCRNLETVTFPKFNVKDVTLVYNTSQGVYVTY